MSFKNKVYSACIHLLDEKISGYQAALKELTEGTHNDAKSSAGDKHETSQAMMQLEHEKISRQLQEALKQNEILQNTDIQIPSEKVISGSLVKTGKGYVFLSIAIGRINVDGFPVIVLSPQSPLGRQLTGLKINEEAIINNITYKIDEII